MAKKKKSSKKKAAPPPKEPSIFWPLAGAFILLLLALFLLLGGFGTGGNLPKGMFHGAYAAFGYAAYLTPFALGYWGIYKLKSEDRRLPVSKLSSVIATLVFAAAFFGSMFAKVSANGLTGKTVTGEHGGAIGNALGQVALGLLDKFPASILFLLLALLASCFALGASPKVLLTPFEGMFKRREREDSDEVTDLAELKSRAAGKGFQMTAGVPVEHVEAPAAKEPPKMTSFRNSAQKLAPSETHAALTTTSDPDWKFPAITLLNQKQDKADPGNVETNARIIHDTFEHFNIDVEMEGANVGPRITQYTMKPPAGAKLNKITALADNLALDLAATSIRMEAPIPGKRAVGIEVPNVKAATVRLSSLLTSQQWAGISGPLGFAIGRDISGTPVVADLAKMPHLLVAGQTGSGKSVMINTILASLLYRNSPADLKLIMVDPKFVELGTYNDIPHLLTPVITEPEKVISALKWAVAEMERRLRTMAEINTSNIAEYNEAKKEEGMPYIVIVIDELADLMMMAARDVEALIVRIAQKARAAGIHLILATQRPSVNVITGLIKANVPARIAFTVASGVDSKTIIDGVGAEKLLGMGDMLFYTTDMAKPKRVQGALIEKGEVVKVTDFIKQQRAPDYNDEVVSQPVQLDGKGGVVADMGGGSDADDDMFRDAVRVVIEGRKASTSLLQRRLRIGYGRAARLMEEMEEQGIIGQADGSRPREVLVSSLDQVFGGGGAPEDAADAQAPVINDY